MGFGPCMLVGILRQEGHLLGVNVEETETLIYMQLKSVRLPVKGQLMHKLTQHSLCMVRSDLYSDTKKARLLQEQSPLSQSTGLEEFSAMCCHSPAYKKL